MILVPVMLLRVEVEVVLLVFIPGLFGATVVVILFITVDCVLLARVTLGSIVVLSLLSKIEVMLVTVVVVLLLGITCVTLSELVVVNSLK